MRAIRIWLLIFMVGLAISGVTAFPLVGETRLLAHALDSMPAPDTLVNWIDRVHEGLLETGKTYQFIAYGTDWLAFAHLVIAVAFWGPSTSSASTTRGRRCRDNLPDRSGSPVADRWG